VDIPVSIAVISSNCLARVKEFFHYLFIANSLCIQEAPLVNIDAQQAGCT